jgi:hypothetical protein
LVQFLINSGGHSWKDIQTYTPGQIGVFFRSAVQGKAEADINNLLIGWNAAHLSQKGLNSLIADMRKKREVANATIVKKDVKTGEKKIEVDPQYVKKQWGSFISAFSRMNR